MKSKVYIGALLLLVGLIVLSGCGSAETPIAVEPTQQSVIPLTQPTAPVEAATPTPAQEPAAPETPEPAGVCLPTLLEIQWFGTIHSMPAGGQFDDYLQSLNPDRGGVGIDGQNDALDEQIATLRDTGIVVRLRGAMHWNVPDAYNTQLEVTQLEVVSSDIENEWIGVVIGTSITGQPDDCFQLTEAGGTCVGIEGRDDAIKQQLVALRDTGSAVHIWGLLHTGVADASNVQIEVTRLEPASLDVDAECIGTVIAADMGDADDYLQLADQNGSRIGIEGGNADIAGQIETARDSGAAIHVWGTLHRISPDYNGIQMYVTRLETE